MQLRKRAWAACVCTAAVCSLFFLRHSTAQSDLQITYGNQGIQTLSYRGVPLEDVGQYPADAFHIWHMKSTDLLGNVLSAGQFGWGETNNGRNWDAGSHTWTYNFNWGTIAVQFVQNGNTLDMNVTETNNANSGIQFSGASIFPMALHFPQLPAGFVNASYNQFAFNTTGPSVTTADFGSGQVTAVVPDAGKPLYSGFQSTGVGTAYTPIISSTSPDSLAVFQPHNDRTVAPGQTDQFTVSLRFAPSGTSSSTVAADVYASWAATWPSQLHWTDRRIIGTVFLASSGQGNQNQSAGFPNNPRRYFNDSNAADFDIRNPGGIAQFQSRVLQQAKDVATNLARLSAQGAITWDIEGEQYPMNTSYVCSPDQIAAIAPEMESIVTDGSSPYAGMKLDDAYFRTIHDAGFRVGVCVRPQNFVLHADGTAEQDTIPNDADVADQLIRKMRYAHDRWGATLFYIDSAVNAVGAPLNASIFQQAAAALPDSLIMPEESTPKHYAYTAPFLTFLFHGDLGTNPSIYNYYPNAFSVNLINDVDPGTLAAGRAALTASLAHGDVLMAHAEYWQANNDTIVQMYRDAAQLSTPAPSTPPPAAPAPTAPAPAAPAPIATSTTPAPAAPATPVSSSSATQQAQGLVNPVIIVSPIAGASVAGTIQVSANINLTLDAAGSYLMVDGAEVGTSRVSSGPYNYGLDTTTLSSGTHSLQIWAHDIGNNTRLSDAITVTVTNGTTAAQAPATASPNTIATTTNGTTAASITYPIALTFPSSGQTVSGVVAIAGAITQTLDAAGSYLMVDGQPLGTSRVTSAPYLYQLDTSLLANGTHQLQIWAHDIGNNNLLSNIITVLVQH